MGFTVGLGKSGFGIYLVAEVIAPKSLYFQFIVGTIIPKSVKVYPLSYQV